MVADISTDLLNNTSPDAEWLGVCDALQGHVSQTVKQLFRMERKRIRSRKIPNGQEEMREYLVCDQFTNTYCVFVADLLDGERYSVVKFVGSDKRGLNKRYAVFKKFSDDMLADMQTEAWVFFGRANVAIMKARQAANLVTLTT